MYCAGIFLALFASMRVELFPYHSISVFISYIISNALLVNVIFDISVL